MGSGAGSARTRAVDRQRDRRAWRPGVDDSRLTWRVAYAARRFRRGLHVSRPGRDAVREKRKQVVRGTSTAHAGPLLCRNEPGRRGADDGKESPGPCRRDWRSPGNLRVASAVGGSLSRMRRHRRIRYDTETTHAPDYRLSGRTAAVATRPTPATPAAP